MKDFEYVDEIFCELVDKEEEFGHQVLAYYEKCLLSVWHATGLIGSGGLQHFFIWEYATPKVAEHFEKMGLSDCAEIIRKFFSLLPSISYEKLTSAERDELIEKQLIEIEEHVTSLNQVFYKLMPDIEVRAAAYIREQKPIGSPDRGDTP